MYIKSWIIHAYNLPVTYNRKYTDQATENAKEAHYTILAHIAFSVLLGFLINLCYEIKFVSL